MADATHQFFAEVERRMDGAVEAARSDPPGPQDARETDDSDLIDDTEAVLAAVAAVADGIASQVVAQAPQDERPVCAQGCTWCCYSPLHVSWAEAVTIAEELGSRCSEQELGMVRMQLEAYEEATRDLTMKQRFERRLPCPLLDGDAGLCTVHSVRPLRCRGANSLNVEDCESACHEEDADIELNGLVFDTYQVAAERLLAKLGERGRVAGSLAHVLAQLLPSLSV